MKRILIAALMLVAPSFAAHANNDDGKGFIDLYEAETVGNKIYVSEILGMDEINWMCFWAAVCGAETDHTIAHDGSSVTFTLYAGSPFIRIKSVTGDVRHFAQQPVSVGQFLQMEDLILFVGHKNFHFAEGAMKGVAGIEIDGYKEVMGRDESGARYFENDISEEFRDYGRWMDHAGFFLKDLGDYSWVTIAARPDAFSGSLPTGIEGTNAQYEGHVLGAAYVVQSPPGQKLRGDPKGIVRGDFFLLARFGAEGLRLDAAAQMSRDGHTYNGGDWVRWLDLDTYADGSFTKGDHYNIPGGTATPIKPGIGSGGNDDDRGYPFEGAFFGPNHEEVAGTFSWTESSTNETVVAAFGAQKQ